MSKTQVFLLMDIQQSTMRLPADISYVDQEAGFNDYIFGYIDDTRSNPAWKGFHYFIETDIAGTILPILKKQKQEVKLAFVMPECLEKVAIL